MNILVCKRVDGAWGYITDSYINALRDVGHRVTRWDGLYESWQDFNPDLYIGCSGHRQPIPPKRNAKIAIHVNPYGPVKINGINESDDAIRWALNQSPDVVFGYGHDDDAILWSYWNKKHQIRWIPMPNAGDKTIFRRTLEVDKRYDLIYLGGRWQYKALTIDSYLLPVLDAIHNHKICGWGDWPVKYNVKGLADDQASSFLGSGRIGPCISEKHTHSHGLDIPERAFKVALSGTLVIHDATLAIKRMIPSALVAATPSHFLELCRHFVNPKNQQERVEITECQRKEVLQAHTYHHRMSVLLRAVGFEKEADELLR